MVCRNCGYNMGEETECPYCGTKIAKRPPPPSVSPTTSDVSQKEAYRRATDSARKEWGEEYGRRQQASERASAGRMSRNIFLFLLAAAVFVIVVVSVNYNGQNQGKRESEAAASARSYAMSVKESKPIEVTKELKGFEITVHKVQRLSSYEGKYPGKGMEFVAVNLSVRNKSGGSFYYSTIDFLAVNGAGEAVHAWWKSAELDGGQMDIGERNSGTLVFTEPVGTPLVLRYLPGPTDDMLEFTLF